MLIRPQHPAFNTPVSHLKGVGPKTKLIFEEAGYFTSGDLLAHCPRFYQDRRQYTEIIDLMHDQHALIEASVFRAKACYSPRSRRRYVECQIEDDSGRLTICWFNNPVYLIKSLSKGRRLRVFGVVRHSGRRLEMIHPDIEFLDESSENLNPCINLRPVYPPIGSLSSGQVGKFINQCLNLFDAVPPLFPQNWLIENEMLDYVDSLKIIHHPPQDLKGPVPKPEHTKAYRRLVLFELLFWRLLMIKNRALTVKAEKQRLPLNQLNSTLKRFWNTLSFQPSAEQKRVVTELKNDLSKKYPMSRLLQGEVGSGKTVVAGACLFMSLAHGGQAALMAPTEVLARQHYEFLKGPAEQLGYRAVLLTGALSAAEKKEARRLLANGEAHLAIGSQALISKATEFASLSLAVIDEQHRFGVKQRLALRRKNAKVDLLVMSATPIPRSLALTLYGDLEQISLNGLLPGRKPPQTFLFQAEEKDQAYEKFIKLVSQSGQQGFVVTPRIGGNETAEDDESPIRRPSMEDVYEDIKAKAEPFLNSSLIQCLHGRLDTAEQERIMNEFRQGACKILVATSIIEVGVDVPSAAVILIDGAEYFGLAQLHQLRGRVGRGGGEGYCLLRPHAMTEAAALRLSTLAGQNDGQTLAEMDLKMRGPGEQLGLRQSGWPSMNFAKLPRDLSYLPKAHSMAKNLWEDEAMGSFIQSLNLEAGAFDLFDDEAIE